LIDAGHEEIDRIERDANASTPATYKIRRAIMRFFDLFTIFFAQLLDFLFSVFGASFGS
jgi:hypothetical protein